MIWGAIQPVLLVPEDLPEQLGEEGLDTLLVHELAHVQRRDHWVRVLEFGAWVCSGGTRWLVRSP